MSMGFRFLIIVLTLASACSRQTLVAIEACPDGGGGALSCASDGGGGLGSLRMGLVGLWHLDDMTGATATDSSGMANHGTLKDLDAAAWVKGQIGGALETKGAGYVLVPRSPSIDAIKSQITLAGWVYLDGIIVDYGTAISRQLGTGIEQHYHLALNSMGHPAGFISREVPNFFYRPVLDPSPMPVPAMTWTHMAITYDGSNARLYVEGTQVDVKPITGMFGDDTTPLIIGANGNAGIIDERFPGRIDEIMLYNRALTPSEVSMLAAGAAF